MNALENECMLKNRLANRPECPGKSAVLISDFLEFFESGPEVTDATCLPPFILRALDTEAPTLR